MLTRYFHDIVPVLFFYDTVSFFLQKRDVPKIHILVEILSNWGHKDKVGLTELQVFDQNKTKIDIDPSEVLVEPEPVGDIGYIFNGKCKVSMAHGRHRL